jgi:hypothetical protein
MITELLPDRGMSAAGGARGKQNSMSNAAGGNAGGQMNFSESSGGVSDQMVKLYRE